MPKRKYNKLQVEPLEWGEETRPRGKARKQAAIQRAIYLISLGMLYYDVKDRICEEFAYSPKSSILGKIITEANKVVKEKQEQYAENIAAQNIARLQSMVQKCLDEGNMALANKCIDLLNKTANVYNTNIKIDNEENKSFEIKINNK